MDYHSDRFVDFSLMVKKENDIVAVLPANKRTDELISHQGLTYGGLITRKDLDVESIKAVVNALLTFLKDAGFKFIEIRELPTFYQCDLSHYVLNALIDDTATIIGANKVLAIDYNKPLSIHKTKLKHYRKNKDKGFEIKEEDNFDEFWNQVLVPRLKDRHNTKPVHTLQEISLLKSRFNNQIKQFNIYLKGEILAGITIFDKGQIVKSQYGATTALGETERALEYLFIDLIHKYKAEGKSFFSMGTIMDKSYREGYNIGLMRQKIELGCNEYKQNILRIFLV